VEVVGDDVAALTAMCRVLADAGYDVVTHASPPEFLRAPRPAPPCCVLLDADLPGVCALEVQAALARSGDGAALLLMTAAPDVRTAVEALKAGAIDYLLKPFEDGRLLSAVDRALKRSVTAAIARHATAQARELMAGLTPRERQVCTLVADGLTTKEIAQRLGTAESTISLHRARVMSKLQVKSVATLVRIVDRASGSREP
jgi:FixJ family two-component response regulator